MKIPRIFLAVAVSLLSQQIQADDFRVLDLKLYTIANEHPWIEIISDQTRWEEFYFEQLLGCNPVYPLLTDGIDPCIAEAPAVDFETEQVVVGGLGSKPSTAYDILVTSVESYTDEQRITVVDYAWCVGLAVIDYPMAAVVVPRTDNPVSVHVEQGAAICE
jgi:hypothetical protein